MDSLNPQNEKDKESLYEIELPKNAYLDPMQRIANAVECLAKTQLTILKLFKDATIGQESTTIQPDMDGDGQHEGN